MDAGNLQFSREYLQTPDLERLLPNINPEPVLASAGIQTPDPFSSYRPRASPEGMEQITFFSNSPLSTADPDGWGDFSSLQYNDMEYSDLHNHFPSLSQSRQSSGSRLHFSSHPRLAMESPNLSNHSTSSLPASPTNRPASKSSLSNRYNSLHIFSQPLPDTTSLPVSPTNRPASRASQSDELPISILDNQHSLPGGRRRLSSHSPSKKRLNSNSSPKKRSTSVSQRSDSRHFCPINPCPSTSYQQKTLTHDSSIRFNTGSKSDLNSAYSSLQQQSNGDTNLKTYPGSISSASNRNTAFAPVICSRKKLPSAGITSERQGDILDMAVRNAQIDGSEGSGNEEEDIEQRRRDRESSIGQNRSHSRDGRVTGKLVPTFSSRMKSTRQNMAINVRRSDTKGGTAPPKTPIAKGKTTDFTKGDTICVTKIGIEPASSAVTSYNYKSMEISSDSIHPNFYCNMEIVPKMLGDADPLTVALYLINLLHLINTTSVPLFDHSLAKLKRTILAYQTYKGPRTHSYPIWNVLAKYYVEKLKHPPSLDEEGRRNYINNRNRLKRDIRDKCYQMATSHYRSTTRKQIRHLAKDVFAKYENDADLVIKEGYMYTLDRAITNSTELKKVRQGNVIKLSYEDLEGFEHIEDNREDDEEEIRWHQSGV